MLIPQPREHRCVRRQQHALINVERMTPLQLLMLETARLTRPVVYEKEIEHDVAILVSMFEMLKVFEAGCPNADFFLEFTTQRSFGRLAACNLATGKLP